jgi:hypothetical protein
VNFVASILRKGACAKLASLRAISVLPTPVGPIIIMFLGVTSSCNSGAKLLAAPSVAQSDRNGALRFALTDYVFVQLRHYLTRSQYFRRYGFLLFFSSSHAEPRCDL